MDVLFTGSLSLISRGLFDALGSEYHCVLFDEKLKEKKAAKNISACFYNEENKDHELERVFRTFHFETVIYFSHALDGTLKIFDELERLENLLYICRQHPVKNFIYMVSNDLDESSDTDSRKILLDACHRLCEMAPEQTSMKMFILQTPYIYSNYRADNQLYHWVLDAVAGKNLEMLGRAEATTDFLCDEDLGDLLARILDNPGDEKYVEMRLSGENQTTFEELSKQLLTAHSNIEVTYCNYVKCIPTCRKDSRARKEYGWLPMHRLDEDISQIIEVEQIANNKIEKRRRFKMRFAKIKERTRVVLELVALFALALFLDWWTQGNVMLDFIDFKLVYVVMLGSVNGLNAGVIAAVLASGAYLLEESNTTPWQIIFYNVQNWLPFACYFLLGTICGYTRDHREDALLFSKQENDILEEKYAFLNELYVKVLENKDAYNSQLIGYNDSLGKMYAAVKELNASGPEEVFLKAVNVLEEMLENPSVAIYAVNGKSDYARLNVCSKNINNEMGRSLKLSDYPKMMETLEKNEIFTNRECLKNYPAYAKGVYRGEEMLAVILLMHVSAAQLNMDYTNKFMMVSDLIKDTLVRAIELDQLSDKYIEGTSVLRTEKFMELLHVKEKMREKEYLEYSLLRVFSDTKSFEELSASVSQLIRNNDVVGLGEDGNLYLLLSQTNSKSLSIIRERMNTKQINVEVMKG